MSKILSISNLRLFLNTLPHVQAGISHVPCHGVSSVSPINLSDKHAQNLMILSTSNVRLFINTTDDQTIWN